MAASTLKNLCNFKGRIFKIFKFLLLSNKETPQNILFLGLKAVVDCKISHVLYGLGF